MREIIRLCFLVACLFSSLSHALEASQLKAGDKAPAFSLKTLDNTTVSLRELRAKNNVVLIVLRGWPGYQCPVCSLQVQDYISNATAFAKINAKLVMVYPGPAENLIAHAKDFLSNKQWPKEFTYLVDPDYTMINAYGLRWNAPKETAYPSTFLIDKKGVIRFAKISNSHKDRTKASDLLKELKKL